MNPREIDTTRRPFVLIWELTQACELACKHCRADARPLRHPDELATAEGKRLLEEARRFGDGQLVVLSGGGPLARDDTVELVDYGTDVGLRMTLTPSGTTSLTRDRIGALADAGLRRMALSIDGGSASAHDEFRQERGSFEETLRAALATREVGLPLQVNTTVCAETVDELPAVRDLVADLGAVLWSVFFLVPVGRGRVLEPIPPERAEDVMEWLCAVADDAAFGVKTTEAPHYRRVALERGREADAPDRPEPDDIGRRTGITAGDGFAFVSHVGEVYPSGFLPETAGNVREESIVDIYRDSEFFRSLRDPDTLRGKCGACEYRHVCGGSRSRAFAYTGDPLEADLLCAYVPEEYDGPLPEQSFSTASHADRAMDADPTERHSPTPSGRDGADPEAVRAAIRARAEEMERAELRKAFDRLEARGSLTSEQRRIIGRMAAAVVDGVLAAPESVLEDATEQDRETVRTALDLFDPEH